MSDDKPKYTFTPPTPPKHWRFTQEQLDKLLVDTRREEQDRILALVDKEIEKWGWVAKGGYRMGAIQALTLLREQVGKEVKP